MKRPSELKAYFANVAEQLGISFEYGNSQRILNRQSANLTYPLLWLEKPQVRRQQSGAYKLSLRTAFVVLISVRPDDYEAADAAQDLSFEITEKVMFRLENDAALAPPIFEFDRERSSSECLEFWSGDSDTGWRTEIEVVIEGGCEDDFYAAEGWGDVPGFEFWGGGGGAAIGND